MRLAVLHTLIALSATSSISCRADMGQSTTSGGVQIGNLAEGLWTTQERWKLDPTLRIGSLEGDGADVFGQIAALDVDQEGRIYVFDAHARELRVFGPDGNLVRRFGRRGAGPGEFEGVIGVSVAPDGAVWIVDDLNVRYTVLRGDRVATYRRGAAMYQAPWVGGVSLDGDLFDGVRLPEYEKEVLLRVDPEAMVTDTFPIATPEVRTPRAGMLTFEIPYAPRTLRTFDRRGFVWTAQTHEYKLVKMSLDGDTLMVVHRDLELLPLADPQRDSVNTYVRRLKVEFAVEVGSDMLPQSAPILRYFFVDDAGNLWVSRVTAEGRSSFDLFNQAGRFLGEVELPFTLYDDGIAPIVTVRDGQFYAVTEGQLGTPVVLRARIEVGR